MSAPKFDFSDVTLIKMPDEKKRELKKFKKPKFQPKTPEIVTLSDSEDSKDPVEIIEPNIDVISILESSSSEDENDNPSVDVITLDDSDLLCNNQSTGRKKRVVSDTLDYIPIDPVPTHISNKFKKNSKKRKKNQVQITATEGVVKTKKARTLEYYRKIETPILQLSHTNIFKETKKKRTGLRPIVIDGSNVAFGYGNGRFDIQGVIIVIKYFLSRGHTDIVCFLPAHFRHGVRSPEQNTALRAYEKDGLVNFTPSRKINGKTITPYDDRFIVQYASETGGVIISNDGYKDLYKEEPSWKETIEKRIINYTFVKDIFMLPKDPLGRDGPSLDEILKFS